MTVMVMYVTSPLGPEFVLTDYLQVDAFVVVHAGRAAEETGSGSDIWSVKWTLPQEREANGRYSPYP
jgi:hypothetical protein